MATHAQGKSLSQLEREAEHTRADLIHTVDELHNRVSPHAIKAEVKAYARGTGNELIHTLERKVRENPLQAIAVAAGLAYPAWRVLIKIPAPILLVGAGLALTRVGGSSRGTMGDQANARSRTGAGDKEAEKLTDSLKRSVQDTSSSLAHAAEGLKQKVADTVAETKSGMSSGLEAIRSRAGAAISDTTESARAAASNAATAATDALSATYRSGIDAASSAGDQLSRSFKQSKESLFEAMESHPFLVGGIGLLIGAVVASALPVTQAENRAFGDSSDDLKNRARETASEGLEAAKTAAHDVYQEAVSRAQEQGLTPEVVRQTVKDAGEKVQNIVQQTANALDKKS
jgi:ElaB/YqjD/DUF883 family membrane-anchored ribosome-binding protein/gas vesicle protein